MPNLDTQRINFATVDDTDLLNRVNIAALEAYAENNIMATTGVVKSVPLAQGSWSHRFKMRGKFSTDPSHHTAGQFIVGKTRPNSFVDVSIDRPLIEAEDLDNADLDLTAHSELDASVRECVRSISDLDDRRAIRLGILAARTAAVTNVHNGGNVVERVAATIAAAYPLTATGAGNFAINLGSMARLQDIDNVPPTNRICIITPWIKQVLTFGEKLFSRDYQDPMNAKYAERFLGRMEGYALLMTPNHMPSTNITNDLTKYNGNFFLGASSQREPVALCLAGDGENYAIGSVERSPLQIKVYESEDHDAIRVRARSHKGMGVVAPWVAGEIGVTTSAA